MTTDIRIECPLCGRHRIVRTTGDGGKFLERKAARKLREHQEAGCFGWTTKPTPPDSGDMPDGTVGSING